MKTKALSLLTGTLLLLAIGAAPVATASQQVTGTVVSLNDEALEIETRDGETMKFQLNEKTEMPEVIENGTRVSVSYHTDEDGKMTADQVTAATGSTPSSQR